MSPYSRGKKQTRVECIKRIKEFFNDMEEQEITLV
jgi:hypothetical protein